MLPGAWPSLSSLRPPRAPNPLPTAPHPTPPLTSHPERHAEEHPLADSEPRQSSPIPRAPRVEDPSLNPKSDQPVENRLSTCSSTTGTFYSGTTAYWHPESRPHSRSSHHSVSSEDESVSESVDAPSSHSSRYNESSERLPSIPTTVVRDSSESEEDPPSGTPITKRGSRPRPQRPTRTSSSVTEIYPLQSRGNPQYMRRDLSPSFTPSGVSAHHGPPIDYSPPSPLTDDQTLNLSQPSGVDAWTLSLDQAFSMPNFDLRSSLAVPSVTTSFDSSHISEETRDDVPSSTRSSPRSSLDRPDAISRLETFANPEDFYSDPRVYNARNEALLVHPTTSTIVGTKQPKKGLFHKTKTLYGKVKKLLILKETNSKGQQAGSGDFFPLPSPRMDTTPYPQHPYFEQSESPRMPYSPTAIVPGPPPTPTEYRGTSTEYSTHEGGRSSRISFRSPKIPFTRFRTYSKPSSVIQSTLPPNRAPYQHGPPSDIQVHHLPASRAHERSKRRFSLPAAFSTRHA